MYQRESIGDVILSSTLLCSPILSCQKSGTLGTGRKGGYIMHRITNKARASCSVFGSRRYMKEVRGEPVMLTKVNLCKFYTPCAPHKKVSGISYAGGIS